MASNTTKRFRVNLVLANGQFKIAVVRNVREYIAAGLRNDPNYDTRETSKRYLFFSMNKSCVLMHCPGGREGWGHLLLCGLLDWCKITMITLCPDS